MSRSLADVLAGSPAPVAVPDAPGRIRALREETGRRTGVLHDDPTGSQSVHGVEVVTVLDPAEYASALEAPGSTCFVLTNSRSLDEPAARELSGRVARDLLREGQRRGVPVDLVSRSDSTLRGHVVAEVEALDAAHREVHGRGYDAVLLVPAYLEAGRVTAGDTHWARVQGTWVPAGETEFARDATFGYSSSDLREFLAERSSGRVHVQDVLSVGLDDIRGGGVERVTELLVGADGGRFVVVNATEYADLEVVALAALAAEDAGRRLLHRTGPSFVRALAGIPGRPPLSVEELGVRGDRHGLVVVGSHVGLTSRQVEALRRRGGLAEVELDVATLLDPGRRDAHVAGAVRAVGKALEADDVLLLTSRELVRGDHADASLAIARATSQAVVEVVQAVRERRPGWVVAKGGITSHDVAVRGLGIRRGRVLGQLLPGAISVLEPLDAPEAVRGTPYVIFAGNVGDDDSLAHVVQVLRG